MNYVALEERSRENETKMTHKSHSQFCDVDFVHVGRPSRFTPVSITHENIHTTCLVTLSGDELCKMSINRLRGITLGVGPSFSPVQTVHSTGYVYRHP